jgi:hypothetical protein
MLAAVEYHATILSLEVAGTQAASTFLELSGPAAAEPAHRQRGRSVARSAADRQPAAAPGGVKVVGLVTMR